MAVNQLAVINISMIFEATHLGEITKENKCSMEVIQKVSLNQSTTERVKAAEQPATEAKREQSL